MTQADKNHMLLENFILHLTHCGDDEGERDYREKMVFTPEIIYQVARDYIEEDHVDGRDNPENCVEFPEEVKEKMMDHQEAQGNPRDWKVFEDCILADDETGGFNWGDAPEGHSFWNGIIEHQNFDLFFEKYPKQEQSTPEPKYGDWISVRDNAEQKWRKRRFIEIRRGQAVCWIGGEASPDHGSTTTYPWRFWTTKNMLTKQEIADKFGLDVNQIEIEK